MVCFLVKNGADVHGCAHTGDSVFHIILRFLDEDEALEIAKLLVTSYDCDSLRANSSGITPFHIAIEQGHISVAQYLLSLGIPLPPHIPAMLIPWGWLWVTKQMTQFLLKNGVDVHECTGTGDTLFHIALILFDEDEALEIAKLLVTSHGCNPLRANSFGKTLFDIAIERGHIDVTQYFLSLGIPLPPHILVTFLVEPYYEWTWSKAKTVEMVCFLVKNGADVHACTATGDTALHIALESFDEDEALKIAKLLVTSYGCDPLRANSSEQTSFHIAIERGHISVVRYLLSLGVHLPPDVLVTGTLDLRDLWRISKEVVCFLVENGADVHTRTETGDTVLHIALQSFYDDEDGALEIANLLVTSYDCDPLRSNSFGKTSFHIAIERGHISVVEYLLSLGVPLPPDILVKLDPRSEWKRTEMVRLLVENGADVHANTETGDSVLYIALESLEIAKLLGGCGSNPVDTHSSGTTSFHTTTQIEWGHIAVARHLRSLGVPLPPDILATLDPQDIWRTVQMVCPLVGENGTNIHARDTYGDSGTCDLDKVWVWSVPHETELNAGREWIYFRPPFLVV